MYEYAHDDLLSILSGILHERISPEALGWMNERASQPQAIPSSFAIVPRKTGKQEIVLSASDADKLYNTRAGFSIDGWTIDRLARVWMLLHIDITGKENYLRTIESFFNNAEVNELVALYSSMPLLAYPSAWTLRCCEGIRNNIGDVLSAIMINNPYPAEQLNENAWNQMVLKAFFTEMRVEKIIGLDRRTNSRLAYTLSDYAHERWAAKRSVNPQLWRCVASFIDESLFADIEIIASSGNVIERKAAALACFDSHYPPAKKLLETDKENYQAIVSGELTWNSLAEKNKEYVLHK